MKKSIIIVTIVAAMFVLAACDENGNNDEVSNPFRGGTQSLSVSFEDENPPSEVFSDEDFYISMRISNQGEHTVPENDLTLRVQGINPDTYGLSEDRKTLSPSLRGTVYDPERNVVEGDEEYIEFGPLQYDGTPSATLSDQPIQAAACYSYGTEALSSICIKEDISSDDPGDVCAVNEDKTVYNSAGPVQVTSFSQSRRGSNSIAFSFDVEYVGTGDLYGPSSSPSCEDEEDEVYVDIDAPSGTDCSRLGGGTSGTLRLSGGSRMVSCELDVSDVTSSYIEQVGIELDYSHRQVMTTTLDVRPE